MVQPLRLKVVDRKNFEEAFFEHEPCGGVFVAGPAEISVGERVDVRIEFPLDYFRLRGRVIWRRVRASRRPGLEPGVAVAFLPEQAGAVRRLVRYAFGTETGSQARRERRVRLELKVRYNSFLSLARDMVEDGSRGGLRIRSEKPPRVGQPVTIFLRPPQAFLPIRLVGQVVWSRPDDHQFGVRFTGSSARDRARIDKLLRRAVKEAP